MFNTEEIPTTRIDDMIVETASGTRYMVRTQSDGVQTISRFSEIPLVGATSGRNLADVIDREPILEIVPPVVGESMRFRTAAGPVTSTRILSIGRIV